MTLMRTSSKVIILVSGRAGSGKGEVAKFFCRYHNFVEISFADALKEHAANKYNIDKNLFYSQEGKKSVFMLDDKITNLRQILIDEAALAKKESEDIWVDKVLEKIEVSDDKNVIISDFRYPNEYTKLATYYHRISTIRVVRDGIDWINDDSERQLDYFVFDYTLNNRGSLADLYDRLRKITIHF
jgi:hypothetical protein